MARKSVRRGRAGRATSGSASPTTTVTKWRLSLAEACALCDLSPNYVRGLIAINEFPPRVIAGNKPQFIATEVRAWAEGRDWRAIVAERAGEVANA